MPFQKRANTKMTDLVGGYYEFLPDGYNTNNQYPCFIHFHGIGVQGTGSSTDLDKLKTEGMSGVIWAYGGTFPYNAIVICPQYTGGYMGGYTIQNVINYVKANYAVDPTRVYLSGYSLGGAVVDSWGDVGNLTDVAAIIATASAAFYNSSIANKYKTVGMPFLFHHGDSDDTIPYQRSVDWRNGLNSSPSIQPPAILNTVSNGEHNVDQTVLDPYYKFNNITTYDWALQYSRTANSGGGGTGGGTGGGGTTPPAVQSKVLVGAANQTLNGENWYGLPESSISGGLNTSVQIIWGEDKTIANNGAYSQEIYKSCRLATYGFTINHPYPNGAYTLRLHFCEFWKNGAGINVFNVISNGQRLDTGLDVWVAAGGRFRALYKDYPVTVSNGVLSIECVPTSGDSMLSAFEVLPLTNQVPTVNAGADQDINGSSATLTGTASDPEGSTLTYLWTKQSGGTAAIATPTAASTSVTGLVAGTYVFRLTVTDGSGATAFDDVTINVNATPSVSAGGNQNIYLPTNSVTLTATATDPDGSIASYSWVKQSGGAAVISAPTAASTSVTGLEVGTYVFRVTVTDNRGARASSDVTVVVNPEPASPPPPPPPPNNPPTANAGADQTITLPTSSATLSGIGSDSDGNIVSYAWSKVSGPTGGSISSPNSAVTTVTGLVAGTYVFRLTVRDNANVTASDDVIVTVNAASGTVYIKHVGRRIGANGSGVSVSIVYGDGTSEVITQRNSSAVRSASRIMQLVDGITRPTAYIWFADGSSRVITKKGE